MAWDILPKGNLQYFLQKLKGKLDLKVDAVSGKGLSTNDFTTEEKNKLSGIEAGAQVNPTIDSALSDSSTNAVQNKVVKSALDGKADSDEISGSKSINGNPIAISDAANAYAEEVIANIEPIQDLHGYDHPWVGGAGKNLLPMTVEGIKAANTEGIWNGNAYTINGVTFTILTDNDGNIIGIKANGTVSARIDYSLYQGLLPEGNYMLNGYVYTGDGGLYFHQSGSRIYDYGVNEEGVAISIDSSTAYIRLGINSGVVLNNLLFKPMIRLAIETDASFAPYSNICPISGLYSVEVKRCGFNVWDGEYEYGAFDQNSGEKADVANPPYRTKNKIPVSPSKTYYLKASHNIRIFTYSKTAYLNNFVISPNSTFTTPSNAYYINFQTANDSDINNYCINVSDESKNGTYEPYQSETHSTSLPQTTYGGTLNVQTGELIVDRGVVTVDSSWEYSTWGGKNYIRKDMSFDGSVPLISELCEYKGIGGAVDFIDGKMYISSGYTNIYINDNRYPSKDDMLSIYGNSKIIYKFSAPQTYQLTPSQVKLLLNRNNVSTNADALDLTYQVNNVLGEILSESEDYTDRAIDSLDEKYIKNDGVEGNFTNITSYNSTSKPFITPTDGYIKFSAPLNYTDRYVTVYFLYPDLEHIWLIKKIAGNNSYSFQDAIFVKKGTICMVYENSVEASVFFVS